MKREPILLPIAIAFMLVSCQASQPGTAPMQASQIAGDAQDQPVDSIARLPELEASGQQNIHFGYLNDDGNHFLEGNSSLDRTTPIELALPFQPAWLVGVETEKGSGWVAVANSGEVQAFEVVGREVHALSLDFGRLPAGTQPSVYSDGESVYLLRSNDPNASAPSAPVFLTRSQRVAYIDKDGGLNVANGEVTERLPVGGLPDARLLVDEGERLLLLGRSTDRYAHGVLGDAFEAGSILLVQTNPTLEVVSEIQLEEQEVFEGVSPIWKDLNGDGQREIIVTVSDREQGASVAIFAEEGRLLARSEAIGQAYRWRHQISAADYAGVGEVEITAVLTPHIGGVLQYFAWVGEQLQLKAEVQGVSSHQIGSGNLDMALSGDFDGDQRIESLIPNTGYDVLGAFQREGSEVLLDWEIPLGSRLSTNLAGIAFDDGTLGFGLGLESGIIRIWLPD